MRTPNTECILCKKPLYRRPYEIAKVRYAACMGCRAKAQSVVGVTDAQRAGLSKGSVKGTNHRAGYKHREDSKAKVSASNRAFWAANPEKAKERGASHRGELAYNWRGGATKLNVSIRQMPENLRWMDAVKLRDGKCVECSETANLEAHHITPLADLIRGLGIKSRDDARLNASVLWDIGGGKTLCQGCHFAEHGRTGATLVRVSESLTLACAVCGVAIRRKPSAIRQNNYCSKACSAVGNSRASSGVNNPNYRTGLCERRCLQCGGSFYVKPAKAKSGSGNFCSRECVNASRRKDVQSVAAAPSGAIHQAAEPRIG